MAAVSGFSEYLAEHNFRDVAIEPKEGLVVYGTKPVKEITLPLTYVDPDGTRHRYDLHLSQMVEQLDPNASIRLLSEPVGDAKLISHVSLYTNHGEIIIELDHEKAPLSAKNFVEYAQAGHYNNTTFHRVIKNFMIQGGGFMAGHKMDQKPTKAPIANEADNGLKNVRGAIAMARTNDPHSATAQFFINTVDNDFLNHTSRTPQGWGYAVFGKVVGGMDVVDKIRDAKTGNRGFHQDVPLEDVIIQSTSLWKQMGDLSIQAVDNSDSAA